MFRKSKCFDSLRCQLDQLGTRKVIGLVPTYGRLRNKRVNTATRILTIFSRYMYICFAVVVEWLKQHESSTSVF